jgi:hypothetical protein
LETVVKDYFTTEAKKYPSGNGQTRGVGLAEEGSQPVCGTQKGYKV